MYLIICIVGDIKLGVGIIVCVCYVVDLVCVVGLVSVVGIVVECKKCGVVRMVIIGCIDISYWYFISIRIIISICNCDVVDVGYCWVSDIYWFVFYVSNIICIRIGLIYGKGWGFIIKYCYKSIFGVIICYGIIYVGEVKFRWFSNSYYICLYIIVSICYGYVVGVSVYVFDDGLFVLGGVVLGDVDDCEVIWGI